MFFQNNEVFSGEQEKESIICVRIGWINLSLMINVCHHLASFVMPIRDPRDGFFILTYQRIQDRVIPMLARCRKNLSHIATHVR